MRGGMRLDAGGSAPLGSWTGSSVVAAPKAASSPAGRVTRTEAGRVADERVPTGILRLDARLVAAANLDSGRKKRLFSGALGA